MTRDRVADCDWSAVAEELDRYGGALLPQLIEPAEAADLRGLYDRDELFRSTVDMSRHRFGSGEYRYFAEPLPAPVAELKRALYPRLLPIARDWWTRLGREPLWPDTLEEWLEMCHAAGQTKSTAILLRYEAGTGTRCTVISTVTSSFPCRSSSTSARPASTTPAASSCWWSNGREPSPEEPPRSCPTATATCSPRASAPWPPGAAGRPHRSGTASRRSGRAGATHSGWSSTTLPDHAATARRPGHGRRFAPAPWNCDVPQATPSRLRTRAVRQSREAVGQPRES